jgi:hypothetical protein
MAYTPIISRDPYKNKTAHASGGSNSVLDSKQNSLGLNMILLSSDEIPSSNYSRTQKRGKIISSIVKNAETSEIMDAENQMLRNVYSSNYG